MANHKHTAKELAALRARQHAKREAVTDYKNDLQVLSFRQSCALIGVSGTTFKRILKSDDAPPVVMLSARRIGFTVGAIRKWQQRRTLAG